MIFEKEIIPCEFVDLPLTKREYFAGLALQGLASIPCDGYALTGEQIIEADVTRAVAYADALLKRLEETK